MFSWPWLGGFIDAEGSFASDASNSWNLKIYQNDRELFERLADWLPVKSAVYTNHRGESLLRLTPIPLKRILPELGPHLHSVHRRTQASRFVQIPEEACIEDAYLAGFAEGDGCFFGYSYGHQTGFHLTLVQKRDVLLKRIQTYLGKGHIQFNGRCYHLRIHDGPRRAQLVGRLYPHINSQNTIKRIAEQRVKIGYSAEVPPPDQYIPPPWL